jgi:hypothetical protein
MTEPQDREHVTFRPGDLLERLRVSRLTLGATAKRDLSRYYALIDAEFDSWEKERKPTDVTWNAIGTFVCTRSWPKTPDPLTFFSQAQSFFGSALGSAYAGVVADALRCLRGITPTAVAAIIDAAESELTPPPLVAVAIRGATSVDGSDPRP